MLAALFYQADARAAPPELKAFFGAPAMWAAALSPSGRHVAVTVPGAEGRLVMGVIDLDADAPAARVVASFGNADVGRMAWVNDKRLVFGAFDHQLGSGDQYPSGLWAVDVDGAETRMLIERRSFFVTGPTPLGSRLLPWNWRYHGALGDDSDDILVEERPLRNGWRPTGASLLHRLNTRTGHKQSLALGTPADVQHWISDAAGQPKVLVSGAEGRRLVHINDAGHWRLLGEFAAFGLDTGWRPRFWVEGSGLYGSAVEPGKDATTLVQIDAATGKVSGGAILSAAGFDVGSNATPARERGSGRLLGWHFETDAPATHWLDATMREGQAAVDAALPGRANRIACQRCVGAKRWLVASHSDRAPLEWYLFEPASKTLTRLGRSRPGIDPAAMAARDFERIRTRDGLQMPVYVTLAAAKGPRVPGPTVLLVHGGPWSRVHWGWEPVAQFLASRGYVVIEPEFRGSTGYGSRLFSASFKQWGLAMQDDLEDALSWAVAKGWTDPKRVCIMGASYGGYAALFGPVRQPERYRCAVSWVGVSDLPLLHTSSQSDLSEEYLRYGFNRLIGDPVADAQRLRETSPVHRAASIKVPVLAAWGVDDRRVPIEHGRRFRDAAAQAGVALDYVEYVGEGHSWMLEATRVDFFSRVERFLAKSLADPP